MGRVSMLDTTDTSGHQVKLGYTVGQYFKTVCVKTSGGHLCDGDMIIRLLSLSDLGRFSECYVTVPPWRQKETKAGSQREKTLNIAFKGDLVCVGWNLLSTKYLILSSKTNKGMYINAVKIIHRDNTSHWQLKRKASFEMFGKSEPAITDSWKLDGSARSQCGSHILCNNCAFPANIPAVSSVIKSHRACGLCYLASL